jgi:hypothetical protein
MAATQCIRRRALALTEIDALTVNLIHDVRSLEARLERGGLGLAVLAYPELRIIEASAECIRAELQEARASAPSRPLTPWRPYVLPLAAVGALALAGGRIWRRSRSSTH